MQQGMIGRVVGALFLAAFLLYGFGNWLVDRVAGAEEVVASVARGERQLAFGALLMLANSVAVATIGVLVLQVLPRRRSVVANGYLVARVFEAVMLAVGVLAVLLMVPAAEQNDAGVTQLLWDANGVAFTIAMIGLGIGSVPFCWVLLREALAHRYLAILGIAGYAVFALGYVLELFGISAGLALAVPGGLFELIFGVTLLRRGFPAARNEEVVA